MDWNTKIEMVKALNKGNYEQAVSIFSKDKDWDYQTIDMFINGFNLSECTERQADYLDIYNEEKQTIIKNPNYVNRRKSKCI